MDEAVARKIVALEARIRELEIAISCIYTGAGGELFGGPSRIKADPSDQAERRGDEV